MSVLVIHDLPELRRPAMLAAFAGWPDAAEAASRAVVYLVRRLGARKFAEIDPEEFYNFTEVRPVSFVEAPGQRALRWPPSEFFYWRSTEAVRDLVLFVSREPQLRWRTFTNAILELASRCRVEMLVGIGSLYDGVPHRGRVHVSGWATDPQLRTQLERMGITFSNYEGPSSIMSALMEAAIRARLPAISLWGHAPYYITGVPNPKVSWGILSKVERLVQVPLDLWELQEQGTLFEQQVERVLAERPDLREQIRRLEERGSTPSGATGTGEAGPQELPTPEEVVRELEDYLRRLRQENEGQQ